MAALHPIFRLNFNKHKKLTLPRAAVNCSPSNGVEASLKAWNHSASPLFVPHNYFDWFRTISDGMSSFRFSGRGGDTGGMVEVEGLDASDGISRPGLGVGLFAVVVATRVRRRWIETKAPLHLQLSILDSAKLSKMFKEGFWDFLQKYGFRYGDMHYRPLLPSEVRTINLFGEVWGIGPAPALKLYEKGYRTLDDLKNDESLKNSQKLGLKYFDNIKTRIPSNEVQEMESIMQKAGQEILPGVRAQLSL